MLNQIIIVGRLTQDLKINKLENGVKTCVITLAVPRSFKNENGLYDRDFVPSTLSGTIAENTAEYCKKGDLVGIKGRVQSTDGKIEIIAEKVTFLSSENSEE